MRPTFHSVAVLTAGLALLLSLAWVFAPQLYLALWQVPYSEPVGVVMRRGAALFFGFACIFYLVRHAPPSATRGALCLGTAVGLIALAIQAGYEFIVGNAGPLILIALAIELFLASAFVIVRKGDSVTAAQQALPADRHSELTR